MTQAYEYNYFTELQFAEWLCFFFFKDKKWFQSEKGELSCGSKQYPADFQTITETNSAKPNMHVMSSPVEVTIRLL